MFPAENARTILNKLLSICRRKDTKIFRVIKVEDLDDFQVLIQIPDSKQAKGIKREDLSKLGVEEGSPKDVICDYNVWFVTRDKEGRIRVVLPTHDFMFNWYKKLKAKVKEISLYRIIEKMIRERINHDQLISGLSTKIKDMELLKELQRFLATLKWIILEEDVNYAPPKYMGSTFTLAAYALLEMGFSSQEIRRIVRF